MKHDGDFLRQNTYQETGLFGITRTKKVGTRKERMKTARGMVGDAFGDASQSGGKKGGTTTRMEQMLNYGKSGKKKAEMNAAMETLSDKDSRKSIMNRYYGREDKYSDKAIEQNKYSAAWEKNASDSVPEVDATSLQSDLTSQEVYGGTEDVVSDPTGSAGGAGDAGDAGGGGGSGGSGGGAGIAAGIGIGSAVLNDLDDDNIYGGMDVGKEALKYAGMGASLGSVVPGLGTAVGAAAGAILGGTVGLVKKGKFEREERKAKKQARRKRRSDEKRGQASAEAEEFFEASGAATSAYGGKDIDMFINKYAQ